MPPHPVLTFCENACRFHILSSSRIFGYTSIISLALGNNILVLDPTLA